MPRRRTKPPPYATELIPRIIKMLPCLGCPKGERAVEEIAAVYIACMHMEPPPRADPARAYRFLPRHCCRNRAAPDPEALAA